MRYIILLLMYLIFYVCAHFEYYIRDPYKLILVEKINTNQIIDRMLVDILLL